MFPVLAFIVAAMIVLTTITRMMENQRLQMGTLKALGFHGRQIRSHYMCYALYPSLIGSLLGLFVGRHTLPSILWELEMAHFQFPYRLNPPVSWSEWLVTGLGVLLAVLLVFIGKTFVILGQPGGAVSAALPAGATDLVAREVSGTAEEVGEHVFATGTARLVVSADALPDAPVTVRLWQVRETRENTMVATLDARHRSCIFTNLPPQTLYAVTVDGAPDVQLTVRSRLTFREAFSLMLQEL